MASKESQPPPTRATPGHRQNVLTKYERTKIIGMRAEQLARGSQAFVDVPADGPFDPCEVAERELLTRKLPFVIARPGPDGKTEHIKLENLDVE